MELKERVIILDEKNAIRLLNLYGDIKGVDELSNIVNRHMSVVIDEIEEDEIITKSIKKHGGKQHDKRIKHWKH